MNITQSTIYWMTRCDSIRNFFDKNLGLFFVFLGLAVFGLVCFFIGKFAGNDRYDLFAGYSNDEMNKHKEGIYSAGKKSLKMAFFIAVLIFVFNMIASFVPTTKEMCAIVVIPKVANSESIQELGQGIVDLAKSWMEELKPNKDKGLENKATTTNAVNTVKKEVK